MNQAISSLVGLLVAFLFAFIILTIGFMMPPEVVSPGIVADFLDYSDLEVRLAIVGTVLYPPYLGAQIHVGATHTTVLTWVAWGLAGLIVGLLARGIPQGVLGSTSSVVIGALLMWLLIFLIQPYGDIANLFGTESMIILQVTLQGAIYPGIAAAIGGLLGGAITRER